MESRQNKEDLQSNDSCQSHRACRKVEIEMGRLRNATTSRDYPGFTVFEVLSLQKRRLPELHWAANLLSGVTT